MLIIGISPVIQILIAYGEMTRSKCAYYNCFQFFMWIKVKRDPLRAVKFVSL